MSNYIKQLESRNEQLTSDLEKMAKELEKRNAECEFLIAENAKIKRLLTEHPRQPLYSNISSSDWKINYK